MGGSSSKEEPTRTANTEPIKPTATEVSRILTRYPKVTPTVVSNVPVPRRVTNPSSRVTNPSSRVTNPSSGVTNPSSGVTNPSSRVTNPSSGVTNPSSGVNSFPIVSNAKSPPNLSPPPPAYPANIHVTHDINDYIVHKNEAPIAEDPCLGGVPHRKRVNRHQLRVCMIYNSRKSLCLSKCHRFHVCLSWIMEKCENSECQLAHDFSSSHNWAIVRHVIYHNFQEESLKQQLKKNCEFAKRSRSLLPFNICPFFVNHICKIDKCTQIHFKEKYSWEVRKAPWLKFTKEISKAIEEMYCKPENEKCTFKLDDFDFHNESKQLYNLISSGGSFTIDFESMNLTVNGVTHSVRRLTTPSDVHSTLSANTRWLWYEKRNNRWEFLTHEQLDTFHYLSLSDFFESEYQKGNPTLQLDDTLINFAEMTLTKGLTECVQLRRRPAFILNPFHINSEVKTFREMWPVPSSDKDLFSRVDLEDRSYEFRMVHGMINKDRYWPILRIERIQNASLWKKYQLKRRELLIENQGETEKLKEQYMFHGTKMAVLDPICQQNLDWRLCGTNVGCLYGQGTYFSTSSAIADCYASGSPRIMFVFMVIVGDACVGDSSMSLPPENLRTERPFDTTVKEQNNSQIFVKYNSDEYYPAYVVHYRKS